MKYALCCFLALAATGCATAPQSVEEEPPAPTLLQDIPVLGQSFERRDQPKPAEASGVPYLRDIPILGHLFKRAKQGQ